MNYRTNAILQDTSHLVFDSRSVAINSATMEKSGGDFSTHQQSMQPTPLATNKPSITVAQAHSRSHITDEGVRKVLHERPPMASSSREALMVEMFGNQNTILWKRIDRFEQTINELTQTKQFLHAHNSIHKKRLDNCREQYHELEQQYYITLTKDSQNKSERSKSLSDELALLQDINSKLEKAGSSINENKNQQQKLEAKDNRLLLNINYNISNSKQQMMNINYSISNSKQQKASEQQNVNPIQFQNQQGTLHLHDSDVTKVDCTSHMKKKAYIITSNTKPNTNQTFISKTSPLPTTVSNESEASPSTKQNTKIDLKRKHTNIKKESEQQSSKYSKSTLVRVVEAISQDKLDDSTEKTYKNNNNNNNEIWSNDGDSKDTNDNDDDDDCLVF
jgi:virulence-associated protein VapD